MPSLPPSLSLPQLSAPPQCPYQWPIKYTAHFYPAPEHYPSATNAIYQGYSEKGFKKEFGESWADSKK